MDTSQYGKTRHPVNEVVNSAVDKAEASNSFPPEVLSQIASQVTASVLQRLKGTNLDGPVSAQHSATPAPAAASTNGVTSSSSVHSDNSSPPAHRNVYTPPSPHRALDEAVIPPPTSPTKSTYSAHGRYSPDNDRRGSPSNNQTSQREDARADKAERPKPTRKATEITTVEKIWGPLFDGSHPTPRLGQFLRGLAVHLIEDYEPKHSLVITPPKMQKYYEDTKLAAELYPWQTVFDDRTSSISRLYREVEAQHHLVQERVDERPDIPALTPIGFEKWNTLMILAYPDQEFERLQKAVLDMPICNFDDRKERFPKEISRRLFPKMPDQNIREKLEKAMSTHCNVSLKRWTSGSDQGSQQSQSTITPQRAESVTSTSSQTAVPPHSRPEKATPVVGQGSTTERERHPYSNTPSEGAIVDEDDVPTPQPIERERKPYSAQPGGGKNYEDVNRPPSPPDPRNAASAPTPAPAAATATATAAKLCRSASLAGTSGSGRPNDAQRSQPIPVHLPQYSRQPPQSGMEGLPVPESAPRMRHRANSLLNHHHPSGKAVRHRSPSSHAKGDDLRRSDADISFGPSSYGIYGSSPSTTDPMEDARRQRDYQRQYQPDRHEQWRASVHELPTREPKPRYQANPGYADMSRTHYSSDEDYYRSAGGRSHNGYEGQKYYR